jgi:hypothetical protein
VDETDLRVLKANVDKIVRVFTTDGEEMIVRVISVFDEESEPDMFYELVSTSHPERYAKRKHVGGFSIPLREISSVKMVS